MVWSLALRPDDAKQDPVVYGTKFGVVFLAGGPRTASIQKGSREYRLMRIQPARVRLAISTDISGISVTAPPR